MFFFLGREIQICYESIASNGEVYFPSSNIEAVDESLQRLSITGGNKNQSLLKTEDQAFTFEYVSSGKHSTVFKCSPNTKFILNTKCDTTTRSECFDSDDVIGLDSEKMVLQNLKDNIVKTECKCVN